MRNKTLLLLAVFVYAILPANAELTTDDVSSREYLLNHGHSSATADVIELSKGAVNGDKVELPIDIKRKNNPVVVRWIDRLFEYVDPALDKGDFLREDTRFYPSTHDIP